MIYFVIILMVIIGISFIIWYANRQDNTPDAPERPFVKDKKGILDERREEILNEILSVFKERFDTFCEVHYLNDKLSVCRMIRYNSRGEYKEVEFQLNTDKRLEINIDRSFEHNENKLIQILEILKNGVAMYRIEKLELDRTSDWYFNSEVYINLSTYEMVNREDLKLTFYEEVAYKLYTKEELEKFKPSEDPRKIYWKYFLELEMKAKKQREIHCHKYVDEVLQKQVAYNDLQINYQMLPSAPITDVESFRNFCKVVHEDAKYEDYEIQNYLLLKKSM